MRWYDKLDRKFGNYGIPYLINIILCCRVAVWAITWMINASFYGNLILYGSLLLRGQIWRALTFLIVPDDFSVFSFLIETYMYWFIGNALTTHWGNFRTTLYLLIEVIGCVIASLLVGYCGNTYVFLSLFLAFAVLFPNVQLLLFFIIPIRVKWLGLVSGVMLLISFVFSSFTGKLQILLSIAGFLAFFLPQLYSSVRAWIRREMWKRKNR